MTETDPGLRRVSVFADGVGVDVTLPAAVPIATLMPSLVDIASAHGYRADPTQVAPYRLALPGAPAMDTSMTLAQLDIRDGSVLLMTRAAVQPPCPVFDDPAEALAAAVAARQSPPHPSRLGRVLAASGLAAMAAVMLLAGFATPGARSTGPGAVSAGLGCVALLSAMTADRVHRDAFAGVTFALWAVGFAAIAGLLTVPGGPGAPNLLLANAAAATISVLAIRLLSCGVVVLTAVSAVAAAGTAAALAVLLADVAVPELFSAVALVSVGLLQASLRFAVHWAGLGSPAPDRLAPDDLDARARRAQEMLRALVVAAAATAALGAVGAAATAHTGILIAALVASVLLLRVPAHADRIQSWALATGGAAALAAAAAALAFTVPIDPRVGCAVAVVLAGAAWYCCRGSQSTPALSPLARRAAQSLEYLALAGLVPLTCWIGGLFGAARGLAL